MLTRHIILNKLILFTFIFFACEQGETPTPSTPSFSKNVIIGYEKEELSQFNEEHRKDSTVYEGGALVTYFYLEGDKSNKKVIYNKYDEPLHILNDYGTIFEAFEYDENIIHRNFYSGSEYHSSVEKTHVYTLNQQGYIEKIEISSVDGAHPPPMFIEYDEEGYIKLAYVENGFCDFFTWENHNIYINEKILRSIDTYSTKEDVGVASKNLGGIRFYYSESYGAIKNNPHNSSWWFSYYGFLDATFAADYEVTYEKSGWGAEKLFNDYSLGPYKLIGKQSYVSPERIEVRNVNDFFNYEYVYLQCDDWSEKTYLNWKTYYVQEGNVWEEKYFNFSLESREIFQLE